MRRRGFSLVQAVLLLVVMGVAATILLPVYQLSNGSGAPRSACQSNLKQLGLALNQYVLDWDEQYPPVSAGNEGWVDLVLPYAQSRRLFHCPKFGKDNDQPTSDYFYNARLSGLLASKVRGYKPPLIEGNVYMNRTDWSNTIMAGDGTVEAGTNAHITELPFEWINDENSPARRHIDGANYLFTDGHVKWYKPERVGTAPPRKGANEATFAVQ